MLTGGTAANARGPWPSTEAATTASSSTPTPTPSTAAARIRQIRGNEVTTHLTFKGTTPSSRGKCQDEETPLLLFDMILAADSSASDLIRGIATECGVEFDEDPEKMVINHINYASTEVEGDHTLIAGDDLIQSDVILGSKKIEVSR